MIKNLEKISYWVTCIFRERNHIADKLAFYMVNLENTTWRFCSPKFCATGWFTRMWHTTNFATSRLLQVNIVYFFHWVLAKKFLTRHFKTYFQDENFNLIIWEPETSLRLFFLASTWIFFTLFYFITKYIFIIFH